jgi:hypothetical protein
VASQRQFTAATGGNTTDRSNHGHREAFDLIANCLATLRSFACSVFIQSCQLAYVSSCAEGALAGTG